MESKTYKYLHILNYAPKLPMHHLLDESFLTADSHYFQLRCILFIFEVYIIRVREFHE